MNLDSGTDVLSGGYRWKIDNCTGVNPQVPIGTIIPETNSANNFVIFDSVIRTSDIVYRVSSWHGAEKKWK